LKNPVDGLRNLRKIMRRLDIGIASWQNPGALDKTIEAIRRTATTDFRLHIIDNASPDPRVREVIEKHRSLDPRVLPEYLPDNLGYVGAVNKLLDKADTEYIAYCDNDAIPHTPGWDEKMAKTLDQYHEIGMAFPISFGAYPIPRDAYNEILWGVGCFWMITRTALGDIRGFLTSEGEYFDSSIGHQEEVDFQTRLRLKGWISAQVHGINVSHEAKSSNDPAAIERINNGVRNWVNKWCEYFCGKKVNYHSANVLRFEDWPVNALYLEEYYKKRLPDLNAAPEKVRIDGREYDLIKHPKFSGYYTGRII
jgi:GT2 family glycosyltransferase